MTTLSAAATVDLQLFTPETATVAEPDELLTLTEVVQRLRLAGLYKDDHTRRSMISRLMREGVLKDHLALKPGRTRAGKHDKRFGAGDVERLLASRRSFGPPLGSTDGTRVHGLSAVEELVAQVGALRSQLDLDREAEKGRLRDCESELYAAEENHAIELDELTDGHAAELRLLRMRLRELEHQVRLDRIDASTTEKRLRDEASTRRTFENVLMQLVAPNDLRDLLK